MTEVQKNENGWTTTMRWIARLLALVATGLFVLSWSTLARRCFRPSAGAPRAFRC